MTPIYPYQIKIPSWRSSHIPLSETICFENNGCVIIGKHETHKEKLRSINEVFVSSSCKLEFPDMVTISSVLDKSRYDILSIAKENSIEFIKIKASECVFDSIDFLVAKCSNENNEIYQLAPHLLFVTIDVNKPKLYMSATNIQSTECLYINVTDGYKVNKTDNEELFNMLRREWA